MTKSLKILIAFGVLFVLAMFAFRTPPTVNAAGNFYIQPGESDWSIKRRLTEFVVLSNSETAAVYNLYHKVEGGTAYDIDMRGPDAPKANPPREVRTVTLSFHNNQPMGFSSGLTEVEVDFGLDHQLAEIRVEHPLFRR